MPQRDPECQFPALSAGHLLVSLRPQESLGSDFPHFSTVSNAQVPRNVRLNLDVSAIRSKPPLSKHVNCVPRVAFAANRARVPRRGKAPVPLDSSAPGAPSRLKVISPTAANAELSCVRWPPSVKRAAKCPQTAHRSASRSCWAQNQRRTAACVLPDEAVLMPGPPNRPFEIVRMGEGRSFIRQLLLLPYRLFAFPPRRKYCKDGEEKPCAAGYECPSGTAAQIPCPPGLWSVKSSPSCQLSCPEGHLCAKGKKIDCPKGYFCPEVR